MTKKFLYLPALIMALLLTALDSNAQDKRMINGVVTSFNTIPLNKVRIHALKSGDTVFSDSDGQFRIMIISKDTLVLNAAGFKETKFRTSKKNLIKINIDYINNGESFIAAISSGHISQSDLQEAVESSVIKNVRDFSKYNSIYELISCEIYNVKVTGNSVTNKKIKSFDQAPQVLYVVDNKVVTDISYIAPEYVRSVEFIEDARASIWGVRAANGVLKITLK